MSEIDSYPTDNELPTENNRKIIKDFKIKDLIKYKREKSREKSRDCNYVKKYLLQYLSSIMMKLI